MGKSHHNNSVLDSGEISIKSNSEKIPLDPWQYSAIKPEVDQPHFVCVLLFLETDSALNINTPIQMLPGAT